MINGVSVVKNNLTFVALSIFPPINSISLRLVIFVLASILAAINIYSFSFAATFPFSKVTFVIVTVWPDYLSDSMRRTCFNLALVFNASVQQQSR